MDQMQVDPRGRPTKFSRSAALSALGALGIVYGDIGTSPLYALKVAVQAAGEAPNVAAVGIASLIIWSLIVVVSLKYAILILRADNHGEGGVVAMLALLNAREAPSKSWRHGLLVLGLIGAALLYGDGAITPAISVLSAVEGLKADAPALTPAVLPITIAILILLFVVQSKGTGFIGRLFGPIMLVWFAALALLGTIQIVHTPQVLEALTPWPALNFVAHAPLAVSFAVLGAVFLAVTGGEAMYADMGHFGRFPIRAAWFVIALPALVLNYLGQAALIVREPSGFANPFFGLAPAWAHFPLIAFATAATVIASQAIISGVFSLTQQSVQLGFLPRLNILHTSADQEGQVYLPLANWLLMAATLTAVLLFRSSDALAGAYGIAVSGLMAISTLLAGLIALRWGYPAGLILLVNGSFLIVDLIFFAANATKLIEGGWFPLALAGLLAFLMLTWRSGVALVEAARADQRENEADFIKRLTVHSFARTPGIAAFLSTARSGIPLALSHHLRHNQALQERVLLVSVETTETPFVADDERVKVTKLGDCMERVILRFGFMEDLDVPHGLRCADLKMNPAQLDELSYYIGHETVIADPHIPGMAPWRETLFVSMQRNTAPTGASFCIPSKQVVEVGTEIRI
uniref:potassium transporter Kup n=1 Tax=Sphingomonas sp. TaxID=28214 RepID=UPI0025D1B135|nr:KUP/HAK/KT family potassium transporter [Sphingomonas sp.]